MERAKPTKGRIVDFHFLCPRTNSIKTRPAQVVEVWGGNLVNLLVFYDGQNDGRQPGDYVGWETSRAEVPRDANGEYKPLVVKTTVGGTQTIAVETNETDWVGGPFWSWPKRG